MGITAIFQQRGQLEPQSGRGLNASSHRIDMIIGLLAATAIVAAFFVAYLTFGATEIAR
jgi:hypothetical protein